jgi:hypothetical protein
MKKSNLSIVAIAQTKMMIKDKIPEGKESEYKILKDTNMLSIVSRICYYDGEVIYYNKNFWTGTAFSEVLNNFDNHTLLDYSGEKIDIDRFKLELYSNSDLLENLDGKAGEASCNRIIGNNIVSIFREECSNAILTTISVIELATKLESVFSLLISGAFKEAYSYLSSIATDEFLTTERINKYIAMLKSADQFTYSI